MSTDNQPIQSQPQNTGLAWAIVTVVMIFAISVTAIIITGHSPDAILSWAGTLLPLLIVQLWTANKTSTVAQLVNGNLSARINTAVDKMNEHTSKTVQAVAPLVNSDAVARDNPPSVVTAETH